PHPDRTKRLAVYPMSDASSQAVRDRGRGCRRGNSHLAILQNRPPGRRARRRGRQAGTPVGGEGGRLRRQSPEPPRPTGADLGPLPRAPPPGAVLVLRPRGSNPRRGVLRPLAGVPQGALFLGGWMRRQAEAVSQRVE